MRTIKTGTTVKVISGGHKGKIGKVLKVSGDKVIVEGVNVVKKFVRKGLMGKDSAGSIMEIEKPIHISNVMQIETVVADIKEIREKTKKVKTVKKVKEKKLDKSA